MTVSGDLVSHAVGISEELGGAAVFPVRVYPDPNDPEKTIKQPLVKAWQNGGAATHPEMIEELFQSAPNATHVGVQTGGTSRLLLVDLDGAPGITWWQANQHMLPPTRTQRTRRENGKHLFYRLPVGCELRNSASKIALGVDIRASGGFVCDWSIEHAPDTDEVTDAPAALVDYLKNATNGKASSSDASTAGAKVPGIGNRHQSLLTTASKLRRADLTGPSLEAALLAWNIQNCDPPQDEADVLRIARDYSAKPRVPGHEQDPHAELDAVERLPPLDWVELQGKEPPPREWVLQGWIPHHHLTLLSGRGGIGKSILAQHIGTVVAAGIEYMEPVAPRVTLFWDCEDDAAELWRRQIEICSYFSTPLADLKDRFFLHSYAGSDVTLAAPIFGKLEPTAMLKELRQQVLDYRAEFVILDNIARLFGGSENDRHAVTTFVAWVQGACAPAAVMLLGHPAKAIGSEFSGSTAWEGAVRARLYLSDRAPDAAVDDDAPIDDRARYLSRRKANYSSLDMRRFTMHDGVLIPETVEPARASKPSGDFAKDVVRRAMTKLATMSEYGTASTASSKYLPKLAKQYGLLEDITAPQFAAAMRDMRLSGLLTMSKVGTYVNRTPREGLVLVADGVHK